MLCVSSGGDDTVVSCWSCSVRAVHMHTHQLMCLSVLVAGLGLQVCYVRPGMKFHSVEDAAEKLGVDAFIQPAPCRQIKSTPAPSRCSQRGCTSEVMCACGKCVCHVCQLKIAAHDSGGDMYALPLHVIYPLTTPQVLVNLAQALVREGVVMSSAIQPEIARVLEMKDEVLRRASRKQ